MSAKLVTIGLTALALLPDSVELSGQSVTAPGKLAFVSASCASAGGRPCLALIDPDGANLVELTDTDATEPVWSPDGSRIAYTNATGLFVIPSAGGTATSLVASAYASSPSWSPDGTRIVLANGVHPGGAPVRRDGHELDDERVRKHQSRMVSEGGADRLPEQSGS